MNTLIQQEDLLIGSKEAIEQLESINSARVLVMSDTHGSYEQTESILRVFGEDCDALVFTGDGVHDVIQCMQNAVEDENLQLVLPSVIGMVRGNGDEETYFFSTENDDNKTMASVQVPDRQMMRIAGRTIFFVHGHRHGVDVGLETLNTAAEVMDADMVFYGHTHRPFWEETEASLFLNPGSCVRPRGGFPPSFAVVSFPGAAERYKVEYFTVTESYFGSFSFEQLDVSAGSSVSP